MIMLLLRTSLELMIGDCEDRQITVLSKSLEAISDDRGLFSEMCNLVAGAPARGSIPLVSASNN
jgi:hypothetical protein